MDGWVTGVEWIVSTGYTFDCYDSQSTSGSNKTIPIKCLKICCRINEKLEPLFWLITLNGLVNPLVYLGKIDTTVAKKMICNQGKVAKEFRSNIRRGRQLLFFSGKLF